MSFSDNVTMSPKSKAVQLIEALREANQRIITSEREMRDIKSQLTAFYRGVVAAMAELNKNPVSCESPDLPRLATEDLAELVSKQLIDNLGKAFMGTAKNLLSIREEYRDVTAGLEDADAALTEWQHVRVGGTSIAAAQGFRDPLQTKNTQARPETPEPPLARPAAPVLPLHDPSLPPSPADSEHKRPLATEKQKIAATAPQAKNTSHNSRAQTPLKAKK
jgi:hypothetical protein